MTTSGSTSFNPIRDQIVYGALRLVGAYASTDTPRAEQVNDALEALNMVLKSFQVEGFLWLKQFATLTLVVGQEKYLIPGAACVDDTGAAIARPTRITYPMRRTSDGADIPMGDTGRTISREEYSALPRKDSPGPPLLAFYDPQISVGILYLWPTPDETSSIIRFTCDRPIQDILTDTETFDVPQEQVRRLKYALALEIAPEYAMPGPEYDRLAMKYKAIVDSLSDFDQEVAGTQIMPRRW